MVPTVLIIGGGMAGLSAGCFAQINGFQSEILEMHSISGGLCTAWNRKGYTFDLCIHWLCGSKPGTALHRVYETLGMVQGREFIQSEYWAHIRDQQGHELTLYNNPDLLYSELLRISPEDQPFISRLCKDIKKLSRMEAPVDMTVIDMVRFIPIMSLVNRYKPSVEDVLSEIHSPVLRNLLTAGLGWAGQSAFFPLMGLALQGAGNAGYPVGGSLPLAKAAEKRYLDLGGSIRYKSRVVSILTENDRATGVRLADGTELLAEYVISCADGYSTIFEWLSGVYCDDTIRRYYQNLKPFPPIVFISFGINADLSSLPEELTVLYDEPVIISGIGQTTITFRNHAHDQTLVPKGKGIITTWITADYDRWNRLPYQGEEYRDEKEIVGQQVSDLLYQQYPELSGTIEITDVASPMTFVRYTGNWKGSYEGWLITPDSFFLELPMTLPGLSGFTMAGQWVVTGGGIPGAVTSGRKAVKQMCKEMNRKFVPD